VSETFDAPQDGVAEVLHDLSDQSRAPVRREIRAGQREMWDKARQSGPALALLAGSGALMLFGRLLVRVEPAPAGKAAVSCRGGLGAAGGGGVGAAVAAVLGYSRLRDAPLPVPAETARETAEALRESDGGSPPRSG
jgi:putative superfamily III holin-X